MFISHKAIEVCFKEGTALELKFQDGQVKCYDMAVLFSKYPQLEALKDRSLFLSGRLAGQSGIIWNDELDIDAETIYEDGITVRIEEMPTAMTVGVIIAEARKQAGLSQKALAALTGIDQSDISRIERGLANPSLGTLERIAGALHKKLSVTLL